jgi:phytoene dehydrogenase-like protein
MTAYALQKLVDSPVRITLFEASDRLGGKVLTPQFSKAPVRYEAGAAEFYDYALFDEDPLKDLIAELGLSIAPMGGSAVIMKERILSNLDDIREHLGPQACQGLVEFDQIAKDSVTRHEFYHSDYPDGANHDPDHRRFDTLLASVSDPETRSYVENLIHSDLATEPTKTSITYGLQNYLMNDPAYMRLYGIEGGNERLPRELAARIAATVLLEHQVRSIEKIGADLLRVNSVYHGVARQDEFDFVVVALPHNRLSTVSFTGDRLAEALQKHYAYYDYPAHYLRMTVLFDRPFWRKTLTDSYWMLDRFGGCCLYDESSREPGNTHGVLGWLLSGEAADDLSQRTDEQLIAQALDSLPDFLAHGREYFLEGRVHRWVGCVNGIPGGIVPQKLDRRHQPEPVEHPNLFMVGDYLFDSTINGVLDSAQYVAAWLAALMADYLKATHDRPQSPPRPRQPSYQESCDVA